MHTLETQLRNLKKADPSPDFLKASKNRLLHRISMQEDEHYFLAFLKKLGKILTRPEFLTAARVRLIEKISAAPRQAVHWLLFFKRLAASTLIFALAVTSLLFYVDGRQIVNASPDTYVEKVFGMVTVKHADQLEWQEVTASVSIRAGDLVRVGEGSRAVLRFFDDTEMRLGANSTLLISKLENSPTVASQGTVEVSLEQGHAWVQTLNVYDQYSAFTLTTRDGSIKALHSSFDVATSLQEPTVARVFKNSAVLTPSDSTDLPVILSFDEKAEIQSARFPWPNQKSLLVTRALESRDQAEKWVRYNLEEDSHHLTALQERELATLKAAVGVLPGEALYPVKLAKERLRMALSFDEDGLTQTQIDIASKRLNEAIVLLEAGDQTKALEALNTYQSLTERIVKKAPSNPAAHSRLQGALARNQKALLAALSAETPALAVTEALNKTEELIAEDPLQREEIRARNSIERLTELNELIAKGDVAALKEALKGYEAGFDTTVFAISPEGGPSNFIALIQLKNEEADLLAKMRKAIEAQENTADPELVTLIITATQKAQEGVLAVTALAEPVQTEKATATKVAAAGPSLTEKRLQEFTDRIYIYKTWQGRKNQVNRLLDEYPEYVFDTEFLGSLRESVDDPRVQALLDVHLLNAQNQEKLNTHKETKQKIDRAKKLRQH